MIYVIAKNQREGRYFCDSVAVPSLTSRDSVIITQPQHLRGRVTKAGDIIVKYGDCMGGRPFPEMMEMNDNIEMANRAGVRVVHL